MAQSYWRMNETQLVERGAKREGGRKRDGWGGGCGEFPSLPFWRSWSGCLYRLRPSLLWPTVTSGSPGETGSIEGVNGQPQNLGWMSDESLLGFSARRRTDPQAKGSYRFSFQQRKDWYHCFSFSYILQGRGVWRNDHGVWMEIPDLCSNSGVEPKLWVNQTNYSCCRTCLSRAILTMPAGWHLRDLAHSSWRDYSTQPDGRWNVSPSQP